MNDLGLLWVNPSEVEHCLSLADFKYPLTRDASFGRGWDKFPAIPGLYGFMRFQLQRFPKPDEGLAFLIEKCDLRYKEDPLVIARGQKLYMDFCRDIHALGLLSQSSALGMVWYQRALDLEMGVDYLASLSSSVDRDQPEVGIQAAMRHYGYDWNEGRFERLKEQRRQRRGEDGWQGKVYWLTNRYRRHSKAIKGCWLFGPEHIQSLTDEILVDNPKEELIAIQGTLFEEMTP